MAWIKRNTAAIAGLGAGAFVGIVAIILGGVMFSGEGFGSASEPPEQVYFF
ncbi:hypothetical protein [Shimia ponticola]|uniref:hypothetical protein n=1 Tax=Shimia ponticola TaxID=2582893 RepID=UPI00164A25A4|nr:hypothetical protein [Shimia ponticola]